MRTLKAIIFDMDGVIIDSEPQHGRAALKVLHKYGVDADMSYHEQFIGSDQTVLCSAPGSRICR